MYIFSFLKKEHDYEGEEDNYYILFLLHFNRNIIESGSIDSIKIPPVDVFNKGYWDKCIF